MTVRDEDPPAGSDPREGEKPDADTVTFIRSPSPLLSPLPYERFTPGTVLVDRYRIVSALGAGGMGEVYRAQDLKLGQTVALKFIAPRLARMPGVLDRIVAEVRIGRQVSHPNVCRIYDIGEVDNQYFIAMEYVDGEDLASLLGRIGRYPEDKALEVARGLCAGLAAAHDQNVIHRDLKPANVMIDGRGSARITDFGLAIVRTEGKVESAGGTPAYMAPEQLDGQEATEQSDIFALGLILYELFTGQRLFAGPISEIIAAHRAPRRAPSSVVKGINPVVERVILRCLEEDPADRPQTARAVMAELPGGDALRAALAAGETPSPRMVAAAQAVGDVTVGRAWLWLLASLAVWGFIILLSRYSIMYAQVPLEKSPDVLTDRARQLIEEMGHESHPSDSSAWFDRDIALMKALNRIAQPLDRRSLYHTVSPVTFVYRDSPQRLYAHHGNRVTHADPPLAVPGMNTVVLDSMGNVKLMQHVPDAADRPGAAANWERLFAAAGLRFADFRPSNEPWVSPVDNDAKWSWTGATAALPGLSLSVRAASYAGRPVYFRVQPTDGPAIPAMPAPLRRTENPSHSLGYVLVFSAFFLSAILIARRNLRMGRGDRSGAWKVTTIAFFAGAVANFLLIDHTDVVQAEFATMTRALTAALFNAAAIWVFYIALEPYVRRRSPERLISWSRALSGNVRDPLVGRDILLGCLLGTLSNLFFAHLAVTVPVWLGLPAPLPNPYNFHRLTGGVAQLSLSFALVQGAIMQSLGLMFIFAAVNSIVKRAWIAAGAVMLLGGLTLVGREMDSALDVPFGILCAAMIAIALVRVGLLAGAVAIYVATWINVSVFVFDPSSRLFVQTLFSCFVFLALLFYSFRTSLGTKPLFGKLRLVE